MIKKKIIVEIPKNTKIHRKESGNYVYYVERTDYIKEKKYYKEKRTLIGRMIDEKTMNPNDNYFEIFGDIKVKEKVLNEAPEFSDTLKVGNNYVINKISEKKE